MQGLPLLQCVILIAGVDSQPPREYQVGRCSWLRRCLLLDPPLLSRLLPTDLHGPTARGPVIAADSTQAKCLTHIRLGYACRHPLGKSPMHCIGDTGGGTPTEKRSFRWRRMRDTLADVSRIRRRRKHGVLLLLISLPESLWHTRHRVGDDIANLAGKLEVCWQPL